MSNDRLAAPYPGAAFDATTRRAESWPRHRAKARRVKRARLTAARLARR